MAGRVNTKFVAALVAALVVLTVAPAGYWYFFLRVDADALISRADTYLAQGLNNKAFEDYAQAIDKRPDDLALMMSYVDKLLSAKTSDPRAARNYLGRTIGVLHRAITQDPHNPVPFERLMGVYLRLGRDLGDFDSWKRMLDDTDTKLKANPSAQMTLLAKKYRGIARTNRLQRLDLTEEERLEARQDLLDTLEAQPDDRDAFYYLAAWNFLESGLLKRVGGRDDEADQLIETADELSSRSLVADPNDPRRQLDRLSVLRLLKQHQSDEAHELVDQLEQRFTSDPSADLRQILELADMLLLVDQKRVRPASDRPAITSGIVRAENLLRAALKANPSELRYLVTLAQILERQGSVDEAKEIYQQVFEFQPSATAFEGVLIDQLRSAATLKYVDMILRGIDSMAQVKRHQALEEAERLVEEILANQGESGKVNLLQGKVAMARGQWGQAAAKLDRANTQFKGSVPEVLLLASRAWVQMGELGTAIDRLERLVEIRGSYMPARVELAKLYLRLNQPNSAQQHLSAALEEDPFAPRARRLQAELLAQQGKTQEAIDAYLALAPQDNPEVVRPLASLYVASGQPEAAMELLEERFRQAPRDLEILQDLIRVSQDTKQAMAFIERAREAGADAQALSIIEGSFNGKTDLSAVIEGLIDSDDVPFRRHVKRYHLYRRQGHEEQARHELEQAAALQPDDPIVISASFGQALVDQDWDKAQSLAAAAAAHNIDLAQGMLYYARLEAQQGHYDQAAASFRRGLALRPVYSEGWRQLGDVQRLQSDWNGATASYTRSLDQRPNNIAALRGLAVCLDARGLHGKALEKLRQAVAFNPGNRTLAEQYLAYEQKHGDIEKALKMRQERAASSPDDYENRRSLAVLLAKADRANEAQQTIDALIKSTGVNRRNIGTSAAVKNLTGNPEGAHQLLVEYVSGLKDKATDEDWMMLARFLLEVGQADQAKAAYRQAVAVEDAKLRRATREFSDFLFEQGEYSEAAQRYEHLWKTASGDKRVGYRLIETLVRINEPQRAKEVLRAVTDQHVADAGTYILEALIERSSGDTKTALAALNRGIDMDPKRALSYYQRADLLAANLDLERDVIADLRKALELDADLSVARRLLATIYVRRGERQEATGELVTLLNRNPRHIAARLQLAGLYLETQLWPQRRALLDESAKLFPKAAIWPQLQAQQALLDKDEKLAVRKLVEAFRLVPSPQMLAELSSLLIQTDRPQEALDLLRSHGEMVRDIPLLHALRGRSLVAVGEFDLAVRSFTRAVERCQSFRDMAPVTQQMIQAMGPEEAISQLEQLVQGRQAGIVELAIVQIEVEAAKYEAAMERLRRIEVQVTESSADRAHYNRLLALTFYQMGQFDQALEVYQRLLAAQPNNLVTLNNTAYLLAEDLNRPEDAIPLAQRAAELAPDNPLVLDTLGWASFKAGKNRAAEGVLRRSIRLKASPLNCMHLAEVLNELGNSRDALEMFNKAKQLAEQNDDQPSLWKINKRIEEFNRSIGH